MQESVKESFPEQKVFEMRPEEMSVGWKRRRKSPAENSCAKALDGREARTVRSTGRLASNARERWLLDRCILRAAPKNQPGISRGEQVLA